MTASGNLSLENDICVVYNKNNDMSVVYFEYGR
jgi:hypothetical protein